MHKLISYIIVVGLLGPGRTAAQVSWTSDSIAAASRENPQTHLLPSARTENRFSIRTVPRERLDSLRADNDFWYANTAPVRTKDEKPRGAKGGASLFAQSWFRSLVWILILCSFVGVLLSYLQASNLLIFRRSPKTIEVADEAGEPYGDIFSTDYQTEIARAETAGNYRLAVRYGYLQVLKSLAEKGLIDYGVGRTNGDYTRQLAESPLQLPFVRLTRHFDYAWYGQFSISAEAYAVARADFLRFHETLGR